MRPYPSVLSETETLEAVLAGRSIARYGDGEFKIVKGGECKSQQRSGTLTRRLREILRESGACLVGIPNIHSATPKSEFWNRYRFMADALSTKARYGSAFITRPDSAPWIDTPEYWESLASLWRGQDVTLVRGSTKSLTAEWLVEDGARVVTEIVAPRQHAWADYKDLLARIGTPRRALICLGPTATVLAVDLCARGVHAIDCGHVGMFAKKRRRGEPLVVTEEDKVA